VTFLAWSTAAANCFCCDLS